MDLLFGMRLFARVVEIGGFTAVARENSPSQPTISRTIAALEAHLGVRLLNRSSRALTLTDDFVPVDQLLARLFVERGN